MYDDLFFMSNPLPCFLVYNSRVPPRTYIITGLLCMILILGGCQESPESDDLPLGDRAPERVVSLAPSITEMIYAAGGGALLAGVTTADDYPPAVDTLPRFSAHPLSVEAVVELEPDLIVGSEQVNAESDVEMFSSLDIPTVLLPSERLADVFEGIEQLGRVLGTEDAAGQTNDELQNRLDHLQSITDTLDERPRTLFLAGDETLYAFGADSYVHELIERAGGESLTADLDVRNPVLNSEYVLEAQPEVIIGAFGEDYDPSRLVELHPAWETVPAVAEGRVYSLDPALVVRPGPRVVEGAWRMAELLHGITADTAGEAL